MQIPGFFRTHFGYILKTSIWNQAKELHKPSPTCFVKPHNQQRHHGHFANCIILQKFQYEFVLDNLYLSVLSTIIYPILRLRGNMAYSLLCAALFFSEIIMCTVLKIWTFSVAYSMFLDIFLFPNSTMQKIFQNFQILDYTWFKQIAICLSSAFFFIGETSSKSKTGIYKFKKKR